MHKSRYDYGKAGFFGLLTPQANPTVEAEMRFLLPQDGVICSTRCVSSAKAADQRLIDYIERLAETVTAFDTLTVDVAAFACTGSSYLVGAEREKSLLENAAQVLGAPVISATQAIDQALRAMGAEVIALIAPYPETLIEAGVQYWSAKGYRIATALRVQTASSDTRSIYQLGSADAAECIKHARAGVDAVLVSGTGMPTLALYEETVDPPMFSSNPCLASAMLRSVESDPLKNLSVQELARRAMKVLQRKEPSHA